LSKRITNGRFFCQNIRHHNNSIDDFIAFAYNMFLKNFYRKTKPTAIDSDFATSSDDNLIAKAEHDTWTAKSTKQTKRILIYIQTHRMRKRINIESYCIVEPVRRTSNRTRVVSPDNDSTSDEMIAIKSVSITFSERYEGL
jgi:hypothetical protein